MSEQFSKQYLEDGTLSPLTMIDKTEVSTLVFVWTVNAYRKLKEKVIYSKKAVCVEHGLEWILRLIRHGGNVCISLYTNHFRRSVYFSIRSHDESGWKDNPVCKELSNGHYPTIFDDCLISDPNSKYLSHNGALIVQCKYVFYPVETSTTYLRYGHLRMPDDAQEFSNDIKKLYETGCNSDFIVIVDEKEFKVHKLVLSARSKFFQKCFTGKSYKKIGFFRNVSPKIMHEVLLYIYSGKVEEDLDFRTIMEMFHVAETLNIPSLLFRCSEQLDKSLSVDNVFEIALFAKEYKLEELRDAIIEFLSEVEDKELVEEIKEMLNFKI